jgi:hypothetical protein
MDKYFNVFTSFRMQKTTPAMMVLIMLSVVILVVILEKQISSALPQTTPITSFNFTKLIREKFNGSSDTEYVSVMYESPNTIVLEGRKIAHAEPEFRINEKIWQGVDMVKEKGFVIDSVMMSGSGTIDDPTYYTIVMSRK